MAEINIDNPIKLLASDSFIPELNSDNLNLGNIVIGEINDQVILGGKIYTGTKREFNENTENTKVIDFSNIIYVDLMPQAGTPNPDASTNAGKKLIKRTLMSDATLQISSVVDGTYQWIDLGKLKKNVLYIYKDTSLDQIKLYTYDVENKKLVELVNSGSVGQEYATKTEVTQSKSEAISESKSYTDQSIQNNVTNKIGKADGIASLNSSGKIPTTQLQLPEGTSLLAGLDAGGKIPSKNLPSYVDDVIELLGCCQESTGIGVGNTIDEFLTTNDITPKQGDMIGVPMPITNTAETFGLYTYNGSNWVRGSAGPGYGFEKDKIYIILYSNSWNDTSGPGWSGNFQANTCWRYSGSSAGTDSLIRVGGADTAQIESKIKSLESWKTSLNKDSANTLSYDTATNKLSFIPINLGNGNNGTKLEVLLPEATEKNNGLLNKYDKKTLSNINTLNIDKSMSYQSNIWAFSDFLDFVVGKGLTILTNGDSDTPTGYCWSFGGSNDLELYFLGYIEQSDNSSSNFVDIELDNGISFPKEYIKFTVDPDTTVKLDGSTTDGFKIYSPNDIVSKNNNNHISVTDLFKLEYPPKSFNTFGVEQVLSMTSTETIINQTLLRLADFGVLSKNYLIISNDKTKGYLCNRKQSGTPGSAVEVYTYWNTIELKNYNCGLSRNCLIKNNDTTKEDERDHLFTNGYVCFNDYLSTAKFEKYSATTLLNISLSSNNYITTTNNNYLGNISITYNDAWEQLIINTCIGFFNSGNVEGSGKNVTITLPEDLKTLFVDSLNKSNVYLTANFTILESAFLSDAEPGSAIAVYNETDNKIYIKHNLTSITNNMQIIINVYRK